MDPNINQKVRLQYRTVFLVLVEEIDARSDELGAFFNKDDAESYAKNPGVYDEFGQEYLTVVEECRNTLVVQLENGSFYLLGRKIE